MKETNLSNEITKLNFILVVIYFIIIFSATIFIQNFYIDIKFDNLENFYITNEGTLTKLDLLDYINQQGFASQIQSRDDIEKDAIDAIINPSKDFTEFSLPLNMFDQISKQQSKHNNKLGFIANFDNKNQIANFASTDEFITVSLNSSITNDFIIITITIASFTILIFIIMIISVNIFINRRVGKPLEQISTYIDNIARFNKSEPLTFQHNDEISKIASALSKLESDLNHEISNKNELLRAITHELKTPLAHIVTIMYLHKSQVDEYSDFDFVYDQVQNIIAENNELIQTTLNSLSDTEHNKVNLDLIQVIQEKIALFDVYLNTKKLRLNLEPFTFEANPVSFNLILNNILLNAAKYSYSYLHIQNSKGIIKIQNDFEETTQNGVGKTIIAKLSESEDYTIESTIDNNIYTTIINLNIK